MKKINKLLSFIEIKKAFIIMAFILIALGFLEQFFLLFLCVTVHEAMHVLAAARYGIRTSRVVITAVGETSVMDGIESLKMQKKIIIVLAGPFSNICMGILGMAFGADEFASVNFSIAVFNLLPVYPLDGGRLLRYALGEITGFINSYRLAGKTARFACRLIIAIGFVQVTFYPYNISLICAGLYLLSVNRRFSSGVYEFYKLKLDSKSASVSTPRMRRTSVLTVDSNLPVSELLKLLKESRFYFFVIISNNEAAFLTDELQLLKYISEHGLNKTIGELCVNTLCKDDD